jgi:hypothetical protein
MTNRRLAVAALGLCLALPALGQQATPVPAESPNPRNVPLAVQGGPVDTMRVTLRPSGRRGGYQDRDNCPVVSSHTDANFGGGTFTAQGGFAQNEIAAVSYTIPAAYFPLRITMIEAILAQSNATVQTETQWSILIYDGTPNQNQLLFEFNSDGTILPHVIMGPGTRGTNIQASVDPGDPEQIWIYNLNNDPTHTFSIGLRIDLHNNQTADPCFTPPPSNSNAFPCTDNTVIGCGSGYSALSRPSDNWLFAVNCGANGCPPNGGWARFSGLQTDQFIFNFCITGCRPRGDWVMRATWDPANCPPPNGACCFGTTGCFVTDQAACQGAGGTYKGPGTVCGTPTNGQFPGCLGPTNTAPVADAGPDQTVIDDDGNGEQVVVVNGNGSYDNDQGDFIANYKWFEGATLLQDGPALLSRSFTVGAHTLTLRVTDSFGAFDDDTVLVTVSPPGTPCDPDMNQDGNVDQDDVAYLINVIGGGQNPTGIDPDFNHDGNADQDDIAALINVVAGGPCP